MDVRDADEYQTSRIEGALNLNWALASMASRLEDSDGARCGGSSLQPFDGLSNMEADFCAKPAKAHAQC